LLENFLIKEKKKEEAFSVEHNGEDQQMGQCN
jgi:hypothetical protein